MRGFLDIDTAVICNNDFSEDNLRNTFDIFVERGFKKFIFLFDFDFDYKVPSQSIQTIKDIRYRLNMLRPKGVHAECYFKFIFSEAIKDNLYIDKMLPKNSRTIFLDIMPFCEDDSIGGTLNYLLYKQKKLPIFICFEHTLLTSSAEFVHSVFKSNAGVFAFDFDFLTSDSSLAHEVILKSIIQKIPMMFCFSRDLTYYSGFLKVLYNFKSKNSENFILDFSEHLHRSFELIN